jgi:hypothetical protein
MNRETIIEDCLDRLEWTFSAGVEPCECGDDKSATQVYVEFDRDAARAAIERMFKDLKDFAGEGK